MIDKEKLDKFFEEVIKDMPDDPNEIGILGINQMLAIQFYRIANALEELVKSTHKAKMKVPGEMPTLGD